jgi:predicted phosphodiesterase
MRIGIISDLHANCVALDAVLAELAQDKIDQLVCLGDSIQGGPQPAETVARLRELGCPLVMGNADAWLLSGKETGNEPISPQRLEKLYRVREWSLAQLSKEDRTFIANFQPTVELLLPKGRKLLCFHGSPKSFDDVILPSTPQAEFDSFLAEYAPAFLAGGHTHLQQVRRLGTSEAFFFNPGSVGLAYSHQQTGENFRTDPWAEYAVLAVEDNRVGLEFRRTNFDLETLIKVYQTSGRPYAAEAIAQYQPVN